MNKIKMVTPEGKFVWPHLNTPNTKFDDDGVYEVRVQLDQNAEGVAEFMQNLTKTFDDYYVDVCKEKNKKVKTVKFYKTHDDDENIPSDHVDLKFKMKASGSNKGETWQQRPALFDSKGNSINKSLEDSNEKIEAGSTGKVSFEVSPYFVPAIGAGLSLRLKACQVISMVSFSGGGGGMDSYGFTETNGFTGESTDTTNSEYDFA